MEDSCQTKLVDRYAVLCFTVKGVNASMVIQFLKDWLQKIENRTTIYIKYELEWQCMAESLYGGCLQLIS